MSAHTTPGAVQLLDLDAEVPVTARRGQSGVGGVSLEILWRYRWIMLLTALLVGGGSLLLIWQTMVPKYRAVAMVRIAPVVPRLVYRTDENGVLPYYAGYMNTTVTTLSSPRVLARVMERDDVLATAWAQALKKPRHEYLAEILTVTPLQKSELVDVAVQTRWASDSAVLANAVVQELLADLRETGQRDDAATFEKLFDERDRLRAKISELEKQMEAPRQTLGTGDVELLLTERRRELDLLQSRLSDLLREVALADYAQQKLEQQSVNLSSASPQQREVDLQARYEADAEWRDLNRRLRATQAERDFEASTRLGPDHPMLLQLALRIQTLKDEIQQRERILASGPVLVPLEPPGASDKREPGEGPVALTLEQSRTRLDLLRRRADLLSTDLAAARVSFQETLQAAERLHQLNAEYKRVSDAYEQVLRVIAEKEVESRSLGAVTLHSPAQEPLSPYRDRRKIFSLLALLGSVAAALGLAFGLARITPQVRALADVKRADATPMFGQVPLSRAIRRHEEADQGVSEAMRMIRTSLLELVERDNLHVLQLTSAAQGVGKTRLAVELARSLARCGKQVLLVDADFRTRDALAQVLDVTNGPGLVSELLSGGADVSAIERDVEPSLSALTAGAAASAGHVELLANGSLAACVHRWRREFDVVLVDGPGVLPVADARIIARQVDGTVFVVREGHCLRDDVAAALSTLRRIGGRTVGLVYIGEGPTRTFLPREAGESRG